ncbi:DUF896 domain-containing protein [Marinilactibacillus sp. XAAS-LB27]|uniref:DUF896 domain-containing protein n=1 Tax=Marinilactibacillus sp. XAAS-LB27 TaxID=3114538 RepID=UPI002E194B1B|nr:DUF896 domain-containing protein [Marinilactibacillus sp. XAAS-LB27]
MLAKDQLDRINELVRKQRSEGLTQEEVTEQKDLREKYIKAFRSGMRNHIEGMKIVDPDGQDVTPEKLKGIQKDKGIHNRD